MPFNFSPITDMTEETMDLLKDVTSNGISSGSGLNAYLLEADVKELFPTKYPLFKTLPRHTPAVGSTVLNWKAIVSLDANGHPSVAEGSRNEFFPFVTRPMSANFQFFGKDGKVTVVAQETIKGLDDALGINQRNLINALLNDLEKEYMFGNASVPLGQCPTPTVTVKTGGSIPDSTTVQVFCVGLSAWGASGKGYSTTGTLPVRTRTNADGTTTTINGGVGQVSAASADATTTTGNQTVAATVTGYATGTVAFAWFVTTAGTAATAYFAGVTNVPSITISAMPASTNQAASDTNLSGDHSTNSGDVDGLLTQALLNATGASPSYVKDLAGAALTSNGDGTIAEFEAALDYLWLQYKIVPDIVWVGGSLISSINKAILAGSTSTLRQIITSDQAGNFTAGNLVASYRSKYSYDGAPKALDIRVHPWLPQGCIVFDLTNNPFAESGNTIPTARRVSTLLDFMAVDYPMVSTQWTQGVYCYDTLQVYIPFGIGALTNVASS
ncbi:MAG: hypothetical protein ACRD2H_05840 [Terriglobales bacterium]